MDVNKKEIFREFYDICLMNNLISIKDSYDDLLDSYDYSNDDYNQLYANYNFEMEMYLQKVHREIPKKYMELELEPLLLISISMKEKLILT